jgi:hypothetical protein
MERVLGLDVRAASRTTGNAAACHMVVGPGWKGEKPEGIGQVFDSETDFSFALIRTQLFDAAAIENVKKIQAGYRGETLSQFQKRPAPPAAPKVAWRKIDKKLADADPFAYLNFVLQFAPATGPAAVEEPMRARFAKIGVEAGKPFAIEKLTPEQKAALESGMKSGFEKIQATVATLGKEEHGWRVATDGKKPDCSANRYTLTFPAGQLPPANAFWSVTMYDGKTQLRVANPLDRYLINSPMLPNLKKSADGSLTLYLQKESPGADKESNWLPAPAGPV